MKTPTKQTSHRLAAVLAIATAFATTGVWAGMVWIGDGADEYIDTTGNRTDGTAYRGNYFVDAITNSNSGVVSYASKTTVRFNSYKDFGNADIRFGRASLTDPDKIWTVIADNDECGFKNNYNLEVGSNGYDCLGDAYLRILYGKYSTANVYIGPNANNPATRSVLSIGSDGHASIFTATGATGIEIRNGALITTNTALTCGGNLTAANQNNSSVTIDKTGGDWFVNGNLKMNSSDGSTATFYNRGGNLVVTNDLTVQDRGSGEFYMEGGHVTVSNIVRFGEWVVPANGIANLYLNGGVFEAKLFRFHNAANWQTYGYVVFNGGTYKAMADGSVVTTEGCKKGAIAMLLVKVGARGGTIDTAGHDVVFPLQLLQDGSSTGGLCVKGGGSLTLENANVTYVGKTSVEAGTTLVVSNSTVKSNILSHGLELVGAPTVGTSYTIFRCNDNLANDDLANVTCGAASDFTPAVGEDGKSIVVTVAALKSGYWTGAANDGNLSNGFNWTDGNVPTSGNAEICCPVATTLTVGDTFRADTITIPSSSAVVTIGSGDLHLSGSLTNANKLAVASGATLNVAGDLVVCDASGAFLHSNEGTVKVAGNAVCTTPTNGATTKQYVAVTSTAQPIQVGGLRYDKGAGGRVFWRMESNSEGAGAWVVGANGFTFNNPENRFSTRFYAQQSPVTLYSSADWTLPNTGLSNTSYGDLEVYDTSSLTIDTSDYDEPENTAKKHTVTLEGRLKADGNVTIAGCGTVEVATEYHSGQTMTDTTIASGKTLAVADSATLKVNAGKKILGEGTISLAAGTTLALASTGRAFATPDIVPVTLPAEGAATINIDGTPLRSGEHVLCTLASVPENLADHVTVMGTALDGRKYEVKAVEATENETTVTKLVLDIYTGLMIIFK